MSRSIINTPEAPAPVGPYSQAVRCGNLLFVSGQIPLDPDSGELVSSTAAGTSGFAEQCRQVLRNLQAVLEAGGSGLEYVLKVTIFMKDLSQFGELNEIYADYFGDSKPARACVEVGALPKGADVEIEAVAEIPI